VCYHSWPNSERGPDGRHLEHENKARLPALPDVSRALVFRRSEEPLKGEWFTLGGRLRKNETVKACAPLQAESEAGLRLDSIRLFFGGLFDETHNSSRFGGMVTYHCIDDLLGDVLGEDARIRLDRQHNRYEWRPVADPGFVPMLATKLTVIQLRALASLRSASGVTLGFASVRYDQRRLHCHPVL
jgi:8-oxo-dGTP pyrophosphatase MutT (NUDIX family)